MNVKLVTWIKHGLQKKMEWKSWGRVFIECSHIHTLYLLYHLGLQIRKKIRSWWTKQFQLNYFKKIENELIFDLKG